MEKSQSISNTLPVRIVIPVAVTIALFIMTIFLFMIPLLEKNMMDGKREAIMHLTEGAWSILDTCYQKSLAGEMTDAAAREKAVAQLRQFRYGPDLEDYFWINDMTPNMIMHPYRPDLVGTDISDFRDPAGKTMFVEMVNTVREKDAGFVDYLWQWKGDANRIVPKISYVKAFTPWGWVIGTGIYVEDVRVEISAITRRLTLTCSGIMVLFILVSGYIIRQGVLAKREQLKALEKSKLREKQLIQADKMASLGILVAGVAHEINNPATSVMLNAPNIKRAWAEFLPVLDRHYENTDGAKVCHIPYPQLRDRIGLMLTGIEESAGRIKTIIAELKDFSRPTHTEMADAVDMNTVVEKSLDLTRTIIKKATRHFSVTYAPDLPVIRGNSQKLQQVVINLVVNACQALTDPQQSIHVRTALKDKTRFILVEVKDTGPGAAPDKLKKLTDPFFTTKRDDGGTGLGLSISEKIVNDHMGILEFDSAKGRGLTATILLPVIDGKTEE